MAELSTQERPNPRRLLVSTLMACVLAGLTVFGVVLPYEFGIDPMGIGGRIGLLRGNLEHERSPASVGDLNRTHETAFRTDRIEILLPPEREVEVKALLAQGEVILYAWSTKGGEELYVDFHGHTPQVGGRPSQLRQYMEGERSSGNGSLVAAFSGQHGWYWMNLQTTPVTVVLELRGYHTDLLQLHLPPRPDATLAPSSGSRVGR